MHVGLVHMIFHRARDLDTKGKLLVVGFYSYLSISIQGLRAVCEEEKWQATVLAELLLLKIV